MLLSSKQGVLLLNLGTPDSYKLADVKKYLREFLSDPYVIQLPSILRVLLVNLFIIPFRANKSAAAYQKIWQPEGSPLLINSRALQAALQKQLGNDYLVSLGMNYGQPSIESAVLELKRAKIQNLQIIPLFPQYSKAATGSILNKTLSVLQKKSLTIPTKVVSCFYQDPNYINALAEVVRSFLDDKSAYLLMSYHGLPNNKYGQEYRAQCVTTSQLLAQELNLNPEQWGYSFQSRLGRIEWIKPYTDEKLADLRARGVKNILICCPSFVVDCLETLEEIGIRARAQWGNLGGDRLELVPCLNTHITWLKDLLI